MFIATLRELAERAKQRAKTHRKETGCTIDPPGRCEEWSRFKQIAYHADALADLLESRSGDGNTTKLAELEVTVTVQ